MEAAITRHGTFWFFGASSVAGFIFIALFVPETKGKTEGEIQAYFNGTKEKTEKKQSLEMPLTVPS